MTSIMDELEGALNHIAVLECQLAGCQGRLAAAEVRERDVIERMKAWKRNNPNVARTVDQHIAALESGYASLDAALEEQFRLGQKDAERRLMHPLPCGHPSAAFRCGEEPLHCFWCESLEQARAEERERILAVFDEMCDYEWSSDIAEVMKSELRRRLEEADNG